MTQTLSIVSFLVLVYTIFKESDSISTTTSECNLSNPIRLVSKSSCIGAQYVGRLEICHNGQWGTVCNKSWTFEDSLVVCKELGYPSTEQFYTAGLTNAGTGPIWLSNVNCTGLELSISSCKSDGYGAATGCSHANDVGVVCSDSNWNSSKSCLPYNSSIISSLLITTLSSAITKLMTSLLTTTTSTMTIITTSTVHWSSEAHLISTTSLVVSSQSTPDFFTSTIYRLFSTSEFPLPRSSSVSVPISLTVNTNSLITPFESDGSSSVFISPTAHAPSTRLSLSHKATITVGVVGALILLLIVVIIVMPVIECTLRKRRCRSNFIPDDNMEKEVNDENQYSEQIQLLLHDDEGEIEDDFQF